jgi:hypothetical protein
VLKVNGNSLVITPIILGTHWAHACRKGSQGVFFSSAEIKKIVRIRSQPVENNGDARHITQSLAEKTGLLPLKSMEVPQFCLCKTWEKL